MKDENIDFLETLEFTESHDFTIFRKTDHPSTLNSIFDNSLHVLLGHIVLSDWHIEIVDLSYPILCGNNENHYVKTDEIVSANYRVVKTKDEKIYFLEGEMNLSVKPHQLFEEQILMNHFCGLKYDWKKEIYEEISRINKIENKEFLETVVEEDKNIDIVDDSTDDDKNLIISRELKRRNNFEKSEIECVNENVILDIPYEQFEIDEAELIKRKQNVYVVMNNSVERNYNPNVCHYIGNEAINNDVFINSYFHYVVNKRRWNIKKVTPKLTIKKKKKKRRKSVRMPI